MAPFRAKKLRLSASGWPSIAISIEHFYRRPASLVNIEGARDHSYSTEKLTNAFAMPDVALAFTTT